MAQSLASLHVHLIFSTKNREAFLSENIRVDLHAYMATVLKNLGCPVLLINSREDHVHLLFDLGRTVSISTAVEEVKKTSSKWIKTKGISFSRFAWQAGYGAFAVSESMSRRFAPTLPIRRNITARGPSRKNTGLFWTGTGSIMMNAMFGIRSFLCAPFRPPFQGSTIFSFSNPGRCPGLPWIAPLGLRCFTAPVVQFTNAA